MGEIELKKYLKGMECHIEKIREEGTKEEAIQALIRTGVLKKDGKTITDHQRIDK